MVAPPIIIHDCPTCGSAEIRWVIRDLHREWRGQKYVVPDLAHWACPACGEKLFPPAAMDRISGISPAYAERRRKRTGSPEPCPKALAGDRSITISNCPTCGGVRIAKVTRDWSSDSYGKPFTVPELQFWECSECGEQLFDLPAMRRIREATPSSS